MHSRGRSWRGSSLPYVGSRGCASLCRGRSRVQPAPQGKFGCGAISPRVGPGMVPFCPGSGPEVIPFWGTHKFYWLAHSTDQQITKRSGSSAEGSWSTFSKRGCPSQTDNWTTAEWPRPGAPQRPQFFSKFLSSTMFFHIWRVCVHAKQNKLQ